MGPNRRKFVADVLCALSALGFTAVAVMLAFRGKSTTAVIAGVLAALMILMLIEDDRLEGRTKLFERLAKAFKAFKSDEN